MKKQIKSAITKLIIITFAVGTTCSLQAAPLFDGASAPSLMAPTGSLTKGFRVDLVKSFFTGSVKLKGPFYDSFSGEVAHDYGISLGYENIDINSLGYIARLLYTQFNKDANSLRADASVTYGVNDYVYLLGGLNLHKFTKSADELNVGLGFQLGAGVQLTSQISAGLSYVFLNNHGSVQGTSVDVETRGFEMNLAVTF